MLSQYLGTASVQHLGSRFEFIGTTSVLLLYWICHIWLTAHRGRMTDDPRAFAIKDRVSQILIELMGVAARLAVKASNGWAAPRSRSPQRHFRQFSSSSSHQRCQLCSDRGVTRAAASSVARSRKSGVIIECAGGAWPRAPELET